MSARRPYLEFRDDDRILLGLTGPFRDQDTAVAVMNALLKAEQMGVDGLDLDSVPPEAQCIFAVYQHIRVIDLSPEEVGQMVQGQASTDEPNRTVEGGVTADPQHRFATTRPVAVHD